MVWQITPTTRYPTGQGNAASMRCPGRRARRSGDDVASLNVPLITPNTELGGRINQLDLNVTLYGTPSYMQPQSILNGRAFQLGAIVRF